MELIGALNNASLHRPCRRAPCLWCAAPEELATRHEYEQHAQHEAKLTPCTWTQHDVTPPCCRSTGERDGVPKVTGDLGLTMSTGTCLIKSISSTEPRCMARR